MKRKNAYILAITFTWIGFVGAISFMEAWLKFQAPGITIELGLGIGQLVFSALNKVEIVCALAILAIGMSDRESRFQLIRSFFFIAVLIVAIQTFWLLPELDKRASQIINGISVPKSKLHLWYIILEFVKITSLFIYGISNIGRLKKNQLYK